MTCCIKVCRNYKRRLKTTKKVTFHRLPNKPSLRERWVEIIRQSRGEDNWNPARHSLICSDHFRAKDLYFTSNQSRQRLKRQAIPCKALFLSSTKSDDDESGDEVSNITKDLASNRKDTFKQKPAMYFLVPGIGDVPGRLPQITTNKCDDTTTINSDGRAEYEVIIKTEPESDEETASTSHVEEGVERKWSHTLEFSNHQVMNTQVATDSPAPRANHVEKDINNIFDSSRIKVDPQALEWMERLSKLPPQLRLLTEKAINDVILRAELGNVHEE
ncbi:THAP domain-containing protein 5-like isoform X3 [Leptidea sinapis]|uniref:THAP domain-containing protein 5-like isoform X3 n=1 Tax=Leptidea sinapis TaxID=189913 RepID=UPI0021C49BF0|nr:THAP domain-containing protein 5-like isoform X3 [Leptidea sinapis]